MEQTDETGYAFLLFNGFMGLSIRLVGFSGLYVVGYPIKAFVACFTFTSYIHILHSLRFRKLGRLAGRLNLSMARKG